MTQGLQAWDGSGRMLVDIGDYSMRYVGTFHLLLRQALGSGGFPMPPFVILDGLQYTYMNVLHGTSV